MRALGRWCHRLLVTLSALLLLPVLVSWPWGYRETIGIQYTKSADRFLLDSDRGGVNASHTNYGAIVPKSPGWRVYYYPPSFPWEQYAGLEINRLLPLRRFEITYQDDTTTGQYSVLVIPHWILATILATLPARAAWQIYSRRRNAAALGFPPIIPGSQ